MWEDCFFLEQGTKDALLEIYWKVFRVAYETQMIVRKLEDGSLKKKILISIFIYLQQ